MTGGIKVAGAAPCSPAGFFVAYLFSCVVTADFSL